MRITEESAHRFILRSRRSLFVNACLLFLAIPGFALAYNMAVSENTPLKSLPIVVFLCVAGLSLWGIWYNVSASVTFDAKRRMTVFEWRELGSTEQRDVAFAEVQKVSVHEDDNMHTLQFELAEGSPILFELSYSTNRNAYAVARRLETWLSSHGWKAGAT